MNRQSNDIAVVPLESDNTTARVALGNHPERPARVDLADLVRIRAEGYGGAWFVATNGQGRTYVRMNGKPGDAPLVQVARLVAQARRDQVVRHIDGDHLNLTRKNLRLIPRAKHLREIGVPNTEGREAVL